MDKSIMKKWKLSICVVAMLFLFALPFFSDDILHAQNDDISLMKQKINDLEGRIKDLESLLEKCMAKPEIDPTADEGWQNKKNWRKLETGMTEAQVKSVLGEPTKVIDGIRTLWYYPNFYGGYVSFEKDGSLAGWSEP